MSSQFRPIRPSSSQSLDSKEEISKAAPNKPSSDAIATTDHAFPNQTGESKAANGLSKSNRKRKTPTHVSSNACTNCKKARAKCDGAEPTPCTRCITRAMADHCNYEVHVKTAKEELIRKFQALQLKNDRLEGDNDQLKGENAQLKTTLQEQLRKFRDLAGLLETGKSDGGQPWGQINQDCQELIDAVDQIPLYQARQRSAGSLDSADSAVYANSDGDVDMATESEEDFTIQRWTRVTNNEPLLEHIMALYFTWVHPVHMLFSEGHFVSSFRAKNQVYCSPSLINAICAMGCCFLADEEGNNKEAKKLGERFLQQVNIDMKIEGLKTPVSTVTYAIVFLVELSNGNARTAYSHLRLAVESLREMNTATWSDEAFEITSFGIHTLNTLWAAFSYQKPVAPMSPHAPVFKNVRLDRPDAFWRAYTLPRDNQKPDQLGHAIETAKEFAKLSQIIHQTITEWCGSRGKVTAQGVLQLYRNYLSWREGLPPYLSDTEAETDTTSEPLAHVFAIHIHYHAAICQLFIPLLEFADFPSSACSHVRHIATQSALEGVKIYRQYREVFTNRYQAPFLSFSLVHLCDVLMRHGPKSRVEEVAHFCLETLGEAIPSLPCVRPLQAMFCESVLSLGYELPADVERLMDGRQWQSFTIEEKLSCCERLTYAQPVDLLVERLDREMGSRFEEEWKTFIENHGADGVELSPTDDSARGDTDYEERQSITSAESETKGGSEPHSMDINAVMNPSAGEESDPT